MDETIAAILSWWMKRSRLAPLPHALKDAAANRMCLHRLVEQPLNRPAALELDTGRFLIRRLRADMRYSRMCDAFVAALDIPAHVLAAIHRDDLSATAETLSEYYWPTQLPRG